MLFFNYPQTEESEQMSFSGHKQLAKQNKMFISSLMDIGMCSRIERDCECWYNVDPECSSGLMKDKLWRD